ncbi:MAG: cytochrome c biogenesis protein ResB [Planctomycetota bacterium]
MNVMIKALSSHRLAVLTMLLAMHLVFVGTLAQRHLDIWQVQERYFHTWFAWVDSDYEGWSLPVPMVGGYGIGFMLLANLSAAYLTRLRWSRGKLGVHMIHLGVIALLFGELGSSLFSKESQMRLEEGDTLNYSEDVRNWELSFRVLAVDGEDIDVVVPRELLKTGEAVSIQELGLEALVKDVSRPTQEVPRVEFALPGQESVVLTGLDTQDRELKLGGRTVLAALRHRRYYKPYALTLESFTHERYSGTSIDRLFSSLVRLRDPDHGEDKTLTISMNKPLRHKGETFYQASYEEGGASILQVVQNPVWWLPYLSCVLVALGMSTHFITKFSMSRKGRP